MKTLTTFCSLIIVSISTFAQTQLCDILPRILEDSKTEFASAKGKLLQEKVGDIIYESKYLVDGKPFGVIKNTKAKGKFFNEGEIYFFAWISKHETFEDAKKALGDWVVSNVCTNNIALLYREPESKNRYPITEIFIKKGDSFYVGNVLLEIVKEADGFYIALHAHRVDSRLFEPIIVAKQSSTFSKQLLEVLEMSKPANRAKLKGAIRITSKTESYRRFFETPYKIPKLDCYIEEFDANEYGGATNKYIAEFSAGKNAEDALLDDIYKALIHQVSVTLGDTGYYYHQSNSLITRPSTIYYKFDQIGYQRKSSLLTVSKNYIEKTVSIKISME